MKIIRTKDIKNLNVNRTKIEGCTNWNGLYGFGKNNTPKHTWSVGSNSPSKNKGINYESFTSDPHSQKYEPARIS